MKSNKRLIFFYKNKRSFLLIEVIIAFALVTLLIVPLIRNPIYFFRSQIKSLEKLECERIADLTFLDLKLEIYKDKNKFTKNLAHNKKATPYETLKPYKLVTFNNKEIARSYKIYSKNKEKETKDNEKYKLLTIRIFLRPIDQKRKYEYEYKMICKTK
ncbi:MAG: hypothetical protein KR126chlam4_00031 [Candidatus Anoxychlamydiales bacterium]|nr:hypothetical protein [Candidatus Anoxychlamydiales bacterium]NGX40214.1 hypothetical protein [Candidatus Anoxychlamydiales bacterium]HEU64027.1 hypothetical protein [Chlamydiota bacterium]